MNNPHQSNLVAIYVRRYRQANPRSRAERPYRIVKNTGCRREYESLVNSSRISMSAKWPMTKRVIEWMCEQDRLAAATVVRWTEEDAA